MAAGKARFDLNREGCRVVGGPDFYFGTAIRRPSQFRMKQFLVTLPRNFIGCFKGRNIVWHLIAIVFTFILVKSSFDWRYFLATRNPVLRSWMWPAVVIGMFLPLILPLFLLALGFIARNARTRLAAWAIGQAALLGSLDFFRLQSIHRPRPSGA